MATKGATRGVAWRRRRLVGALAGLLLLAACGGSGSERGGGANATPAAPDATAVAARATIDAALTSVPASDLPSALTEMPTETPTALPASTATPTVPPTDTATATATHTETPANTPTSAPTATATPSPTPTETPTETPTPTATPDARATATAIARAMATAVAATLTAQPTATPTNTPTDAPTPTRTPRPTSTPLPPRPTPTPTAALPPPTLPPPTLPPQPPPVAWVSVPGGDFRMGSDEAAIWAAVDDCNATEGNCAFDWFDNELPARTVGVGAFAISKYETSNAQYEACVAAGACEPAGRAISDSNIPYDPGYFAADYPVVGVNWHDASNFCAWIGARLPTEEEWEKAARGTDGRTYPWGESFAHDRANFSFAFPSPVGSYPGGASPYGVQDMAGNAFEWTASRAADGRYRLRGGGWHSHFFRARSADRGTRLEASFANYDVGFRCAR